MLGTEHEQSHPAETPSTSGIEERSPLARSAAKLLYKRMRVTVADGRVLVGDFICMDKQGNLILNNAVERYTANGKEHEKVLGQVLVPRTQRRSAEVEVVAAERQAIVDLIDGSLQQNQ